MIGTEVVYIAFDCMRTAVVCWPLQICLAVYYACIDIYYMSRILTGVARVIQLCLAIHVVCFPDYGSAALAYAFN